MWSGGSKKLANDSSKAFQDIKIFDTLEPKKVETFGSNNVKTALLVDISDSDAPDPKLSGSFLDVKKQEFTLVDLFENLYVTPQHVGNKSDLEDNLFDFGNTDTLKSTNNDEGTIKEASLGSVKENTLKESKRTFDEIFDSAVSSRYSKLDFKSKDQSEDCVDGFTTEIPTHLYDKPVKVLTPPKCNINISYEVKTTNISALDDNFNFIPTVNKINNPLLEEIETHTIERANEKVNKECDDVKILRPPINRNFPKPCLLKSSDVIPSTRDTFTIERDYNRTYNKTDASKLFNTSNDTYNSEVSKVNLNSVHLTTAKEIVTPLAQRTAKHTVNFNIFNIPRVKLESLKQNENTSKRNLFQPDPVTRYRKAITSPLVDLNKPPIVMKNTLIPVLQSIKKDNKAFNKRRIVKKDSEKIGFTKGPDIYEKSVVLPQIIQRLSERRKNLDARNNVTKKLVLDRGRNEGLMVPKLSPEVLMEDCNKERLKALKLRTAFENFVVSGHF